MGFVTSELSNGILNHMSKRRFGLICGRNACDIFEVLWRFAIKALIWSLRVLCSCIRMFTLLGWLNLFLILIKASNFFEKRSSKELRWSHLRQSDTTFSSKSNKSNKGSKDHRYFLSFSLLTSIRWLDRQCIVNNLKIELIDLCKFIFNVNQQTQSKRVKGGI